MKEIEKNIGNSRIIYTRRLVISKGLADDREELATLFGCQMGRQYLGGALSDSRSFERATELVRDGVWIIRDDAAKFIGMIVVDKYLGTHIDEISYQLHKNSMGVGYAEEAMKAVMKVLEKNVSNIVAETQAKNARSIKLLKKLKFKEKARVERFGEEQIVFEYHFSNELHV